MRLNQAQLRRIVHEAVRRKLEMLDEATLREVSEESPSDVASETSDFMVEALLQWFDHEGVDLMSNNAFEMLMGTVGPEGAAVSSRYEDVEHYADAAATKVLASPELKEKVKEACAIVIKSVMEPM